MAAHIGKSIGWLACEVTWPSTPAASSYSSCNLAACFAVVAYRQQPLRVWKSPAKAIPVLVRTGPVLPSIAMAAGPAKLFAIARACPPLSTTARLSPVGLHTRSPRPDTTVRCP